MWVCPLNKWTFVLSLTDVSHVWSADCTEDNVDQGVSLRWHPEDFSRRWSSHNSAVSALYLERAICFDREERPKTQARWLRSKVLWKQQCRKWGNAVSLRSACLRGDMSVEVLDTSAELCGGSSAGDLRLKLSRLEPPQAAEELKELLFTMADSLSESDR